MLLGEVRQANDAPEVAPIWNENVADFGAALERKNKLKRLHEKAREYVYYPGTFVPLALVDKGVPTLGIDAANEEWIETTDDDIAVFSKARHASRAASSPPAAPSVYYYHVDPNGCPTRITDASGQVKWLVSYEAWGRIAEQYVDQISNPLRYQGQYYDMEIGLHYNRYRYYDLQVGQYVGQDPIGLSGGLSLYSYVNNSNTWIDPLGLSSDGIATTWNEFQSRTRGWFSDRAEAAVGWKVYKESSLSVEALAIGRLPDTEAASEIGMRRLNVQLPDVWSLAVNDAWIQGGIDANRTFYLASENIPANRINPPGSAHPTTVFDREIIQLEAAGYSQYGDEMRPRGCG